MAKPQDFRIVALHNALIKLDRYVERNLTQGPQNRKVTWAMLRRTIPCSCTMHEVIRGFPDV